MVATCATPDKSLLDNVSALSEKFFNCFNHAIPCVKYAIQTVAPMVNSNAIMISNFMLHLWL